MDYTLILTILLYVVLIANVAAAIAILFLSGAMSVQPGPG